jgi:SAM-dependent methyltransferase
MAWHSLPQVFMNPDFLDIKRRIVRPHPHMGQDFDSGSVDQDDFRDISQRTLHHYDVNAPRFFAGTIDHDVSQNIAALLDAIEGEPPYTILDLGCGPGRDLKTFRDMGHRAIGLDGSEKFVEMAAAYSGCEVWLQNFLELDLPDSMFDGIYANASLFHVPRSLLPKVVPSSGIVANAEIEGVGIPIAGIAGDQQAALFGQACHSPGMAKNTYGTGCFLLMNTGGEAVASRNNLLTTVAWNIKGPIQYALEGSVFIGGAVVQWLRDGLGIIKSARDVEALAASVEGRFMSAFVRGTKPPRDA